MFKKIIISSFFLVIFLLAGCATQTDPTLNAVQYYEPAAKQRLEPYFEKANVNYPPPRVAFLIFKKERRLDLWAIDDKQWKFIKAYPIYAESGNLGPKLRSGDRQVPEGIYRITSFNPRSHYHLSLHLDYPDNYDLYHARQDGRHSPGSEIFIHGDAKSIGCIAIGDRAIEELFVLVYRVGRANVEVIIAPNDLRHQTAATDLKHEPKWVPQLYSMLDNELQKFA